MTDLHDVEQTLIDEALELHRAFQRNQPRHVVEARFTLFKEAAEEYERLRSSEWLKSSAQSSAFGSSRRG